MYKKVFTYWKEEGMKKKLTKLPRDFYEKVLSYIEESKKTVLEDTDDILTSIVLTESDLVRVLLNALFKIRIRKIISLQKTGESIPIEDLTNLELKFLTNSIQKFGVFINNLELLYKEEENGEKHFEHYREKKVSISAEKERKIGGKINQKSHTHILIKINRDLPEITGADLKTYGPFKTGDIVHIPKINAKILLDKKVAEKINLSKRD